MARLGVLGFPSGELDHPEPGEPAGRRAARWIFCHVLAEEAPQVLDELRDEVGPPLKQLLRRVAGSGDDPLRYALKWSAFGDLDDRVEQAKNAPSTDDSNWNLKRLSHEVGLRDALVAWGKHHHLADPWFLDVALASVRRWIRVPPALEFDPKYSWKPAWSPFAFAADGSLPETPEPIGAWVPFAETKANYLKRVREYVEAVDAAYREAGWKDAPEKRAPFASDGQRTAGPDLHFRWTVRIQVLGWTNERVKKEAGLSDVRKVREAYRNTCRLLGLTPLPHRRAKH